MIKIIQDLRELENDDLNVQLDIFEEHREDDSMEFHQRWIDIKVNFEYPFSGLQIALREGVRFFKHFFVQLVFFL